MSAIGSGASGTVGVLVSTVVSTGASTTSSTAAGCDGEFERIVRDADEPVPKLDDSIGLEREALADEFEAWGRRRHLSGSSGRGVDVAGRA